MGTIAEGERNKMLDALGGTADYTKSAAVYAKLHVGDPGSDGTANPATDTTRKLVSLAAASAGSKVSNAQVQWTNLATADPDVITWVSFWTASSGGTFLGKDDLPASKTVNDGDTLTIASGDISLSIT
jgi:hypothetical protein